MSGKIVEINADQYESEVLAADKAVLDFYSTECPPCEALAAKYEQLSLIYGDDIKFYKMFRQGNKDLALKLGVTSSPTLLFYDRGKLLDGKLSGGIKRAEIAGNLEKLLSAERASVLGNSIKPYRTETQVLILGGGPAGLTAGLYLAQAHIDTIIADIALPGGYVATTHQVSNYPGFTEPMAGYMLAHYMSEQTKLSGVKFRSAVDITSVDLEKKEAVIDGIETIKAQKVIIATGSSPRPLGIPGEMEYRGNGVSYCATCDAKYFEDKDVIVIGGGNSAIEESLFISKFARSITIVHQFADLQANKEAQKKAFADKKIKFMFEHEPRAFIKNGTMDMEVEVEELKTGKRKHLKSNGIFVFAGFIPNLSLFSDTLKRDSWGYAEADNMMKTSIKDVYAIGDVKTKQFRQITTAVADGTIAAITISKELLE